MRNEALEKVGDVLVGEWALTMENAWFLDAGTRVEGSATIEWLGDAFLVMRSELGGDPAWDLVIGRSDADDRYVVLYHDERGVSRLFDMTFTAREWSFLREDPDFHQRFVATLEPDRILGRFDASEDEGTTWRKDFDVTFERRRPG